MYKYYKPQPIKIGLIDEEGFRLRQLAAEYIKEKINKTGAERGSEEEQGFGAQRDTKTISGLNGEFADNLIVLLLLANSLGVDVKKALEDKIKIINDRYK